MQINLSLGSWSLPQYTKRTLYQEMHKNSAHMHLGAPNIPYFYLLYMKPAIPNASNIPKDTYYDQNRPQEQE